MSEGRISDVVDESRTFQDVTDIFLHLHGKAAGLAVGQNIFPDILSQ